MTQKYLIVIPFGGLANRMRVILSSISFAHKNNRKIKIIWILRDELNCDFNDLFHDIEGIDIKIVNNNIFLRVLIKLASIWKLCFNFLNNFIITDKYIHKELEVGYFDCDSNKIETIIKGNFTNLFIVSCAKFYTYQNINMSILRPNSIVEEKVSLFHSQHKLIDYVALHIRYTDNTLSINNSPVLLFEKVIEDEFSKGEKIVVCTDSEYIKNLFVEKYKGCLVFPESKKNRNSVEGMQDALMELMILSKSKRLYGSYGSTFSLMASNIGKIELNTLKLDAEKNK